jgi:hypothetical protein
VFILASWVAHVLSHQRRVVQFEQTIYIPSTFFVKLLPEFLIIKDCGAVILFVKSTGVPTKIVTDLKIFGLVVKVILFDSLSDVLFRSCNSAIVHNLFDEALGTVKLLLRGWYTKESTETICLSLAEIAKLPFGDKIELGTLDVTIESIKKAYERTERRDAK